MRKVMARVRLRWELLEKWKALSETVCCAEPGVRVEGLKLEARSLVEIRIGSSGFYSSSRMDD
jgi:hypothetical protein